MNLGQDIRVYGITIRLTDCDQWTREYLINAGIELHDSEEIPLDPHMEQRKAMQPNNETIPQSFEDMKLYKFMKFDKKVLRFYGMWHDVLNDPPEMRRVILQYYLFDDTMEVLEDHSPNRSRDSCKVFIERQKIPVNRKTLPETFPISYMEIKDEDLEWLQPSDFKTGKDILVFEKRIFLYDSDNFTRHYYKTQLGVDLIQISITNKTKEYLQNAGIKMHDSEEILIDPQEQHKALHRRNETIPQSFEDMKLYKFMKFDKKVLRFYGTWQDVLNDPPEMRRVILQYYLSDDTMEILEDNPPNNGRDPCKVLIKRQKIPVDRNELPETFPFSYMEIKDDDLEWLQPSDFKTGKDILVFGKRIFLYDCDNFTRHYYKTQLGVEDMESIAVAEKPKSLTPKVIPPHTGIGAWGDTPQACLSVIPKPAKKDVIKKLHFDQVVLRFKARLISPMQDEHGLSYVVLYYPCDDSVAISRESATNPGFPGRRFYKRDKLLKQQEHVFDPPSYYQADDFYVGSFIRAAGKMFQLTDADQGVLAFMIDHPKLYSDEHVQAHKDGMSTFHNKQECKKS